MTDEDLKARVAIADRLSRAALAGDTRKALDYAACFTLQGVLQLVDVRLEGRAAIQAWMEAPSVIPAPKAAAGPIHVNHHLTSSRTDLTGPDAAQVRTYWLVIGPQGLDHSGYYDDRLERRGGEWLIALRKPRTLWVAETSLLRLGEADRG